MMTCVSYKTLEMIHPVEDIMGAWYVLSSTSAFPLSQRTRNVISSYLGDRCRIGADDFDNIIQIVEMLEE